jgi:adenylate kinase family enzyme
MAAVLLRIRSSSRHSWCGISLLFTHGFPACSAPSPPAPLPSPTPLVLHHERVLKAWFGSASGGAAAARHSAPPHTGGGVTGVTGTQSSTAQAALIAQRGGEASEPRAKRVQQPTQMPVPHRDRSKEVISMKAQLLFDAGWKRMEARLGETLVCPREIVWLNGAPGSGKGTNMPFIMKSRGLSRTVGMSQLLDSSTEIRDIINRGELVPDSMVLDALLDAVLNPDLNDGAGLVIDGFPRTAMQVDFVKLLYDKLLELHHRAADSPEEWRFPRPSFKVVVLYVDEEESVRRQMKRAQLASLHNKRVLDAGTGEVWNVRTTDISEALCRRRYQVFKAHYSTILRLKSYFPFSLLDAMGTVEECRAQIVRELRYQSSLDLDEKTYAAIRHLPLARDLVRVARQRLVFRLDSYCKRHNEMFGQVIDLIDDELLPLLRKCSLAGHAEFRTRHPLLLDNSLAVDMLIDVLSDRGFSVAHSVEERVVPHSIDLKTGEIKNEVQDLHSFRITFDKENVRDLSTPASVTTRHGEEIAIAATWVPEHMRRGPKDWADDPNGNGNGSMSSSQQCIVPMFARNTSNQPNDKNASETLVEVQSSKQPQTEKQKELDEVQFLCGWDSMDVDLNAAGRERYYGFETMNERED